jgi:hypothetical protein
MRGDDEVGWGATQARRTRLRSRGKRLLGGFCVPEWPATSANRGQIVGTLFLDAAQTRGRGFRLTAGTAGPFRPVAVPGARIT